jgi:PAS domain S-box-containing protein
MADKGWLGLFAAAFRGSKNAMILADDQRRIVDVNGALVKMIGYRRKDVLGKHLWDFVVGGPLLTNQEWAKELALQRFEGEASMIASDGTIVAVQWGATCEAVTGKRLVLFVAMSTSRWGARFRRDVEVDAATASLSPREREVVHLVAMGASGPEIADELNIAHDTVRTHVRNAMSKMGARSRAHLVAKAIGEAQALSMN